MRTIIVTLIALAGGFMAGILLSELIAIAGVLLFQRAVGIKYLPVYLAVVSACAALIVSLAVRRRPK